MLSCSVTESLYAFMFRNGISVCYNVIETFFNTIPIMSLAFYNPFMFPLYSFTFPPLIQSLCEGHLSNYRVRQINRSILFL